MTAWQACPEAIRALRDWGDEALIYSAHDATCHLLTGLPLWMWEVLTRAWPRAFSSHELLQQVQAEEASVASEDVDLALAQLQSLGLAQVARAAP